MSQLPEEELSSYADILAIEFEEWYRNLLQSSQVVPRAVSGITASGRQFVAIINDIPWTQKEHIQRRNFIHWLLWKECVVAYVVGSMMGREDSGRDIDIISDDGINIIERILPIISRDDGAISFDEVKVFKDKHGTREWHPYSELMKPDAVDTKWVSEGDQQFFENVWTVMREKCFWRDRPINTN